MGFNLFEEIDDKIESFEMVSSDDKTMVFKATLKNGDGTEYFMPIDLTVSMKEVFDSLLGEMKIDFPRDSEDIRVFCEKIINLMEKYYTLKVFKRKLLFQDKVVDNDYIANIEEILKIAEERIKELLSLASKCAPLWFGHRVAGLPKYYGDNPYNIHGVDHKYDYLLESDQKYLSCRRNLILSLAKSREPISISEQYLIECTPLINAVNNAKLSGGPKL